MTYLKHSLLSIIFLSIPLIFSGCGSTSLSQASQNLTTATNALAQTESDYFDEIQAASDSYVRLRATTEYIGKAPFKDLADLITNRPDFSKAKKVRMTAIKYLQSYAGVINAIDGGADASWISTDVSKLNTGVDTIFKDVKAVNLSASLATPLAGGIKTAMTSLGAALVNAASTREINSLALEATGPINVIAQMVNEDAINMEGDKYVSGLNNHQTDELSNTLHIIYEDKTLKSIDRFNAVNTILDMQTKLKLVTKGNALTDAMTKITEANDALAKKDNLSASALAKEAYTILVTSGINTSSK